MRRFLVIFLFLVFVAGGCATFERDPTDKYSLNQLQQMGQKFLAAGDLGQALKYLSAAEKKRPNDAAIQYNLGLAYYERGMKSEALVHLKKAVTLKPNYPEAENALGRYYAEQGQLDLAQQAFERAISDPFYTTPYIALYNLGMIYEKKGDNEAALNQYQEAVRLQPNYGLAYYRMGLLLEESRRADKAREAYGRAIEFAPDLVEAQYRFGVMSYTAGELENALYSLNRVMKLAPYSTMADDAKKYLERLHTIIPDGVPSRTPSLPSADRLSQLDVMTNRDLLNEQLGSAFPSAAADPAGNLESIQRVEVGSDISAPAAGPPGREAREQPREEGPRTYIVQLGSFLDKENAEDLQQRLKRKGYDAVVKPFNHQVLGRLYVVQLKPVNNADKASQLMMQVEKEGHGKAIIIEAPAN